MLSFTDIGLYGIKMMAEIQQSSQSHAGLFLCFVFVHTWRCGFDPLPVTF